ncbi:MAG: hypothetical protein NWE92_08385 [Candidatus Bathyarchaeota archaeon]|nr:hypothetical protein [Candidatus Bathyarchaeota archaeon]
MSTQASMEPLPRSLYPPKADPRAAMREMVDAVFNDKFMIIISTIIIPIILINYFFTVTPQGQSFLDITDWTIVIIFEVEYFSKLYLAPNRWEHFKSPWHLVDLFIITIPLIQITQVFSFALPSHPTLLLRLLTIPRVFAVGSRAAIGRRTKGTTAGVTSQQPNTIIQLVDINQKTTTPISWDELQSRLVNDPTQEWIDIHDISDEGFAQLSNMLNIPEAQFRGNLIDEIYPHLDHSENVSLLFLQSGKIIYPKTSANYLTIVRSGIIVINRKNKILTVSKHNVDLPDKVFRNLPKTTVEGNVVATTLFSILMNVLNDYKALLSEVEMEVIKIGDLPKSRLPQDFLERMYRFGKEVGRVASNIVHFKEMLSLINTGNIFVERFDHKTEQAFHILQDTTQFLNEIADDVTGSLQSIIDLYINQTSFDTNRILKILAVITALAIFPSAIGGILGMNLLDVPYTAVLWQIVMVICLIMFFMGYACLKLGWLKT